MIFNTYWFLCSVLLFFGLYWLIPAARVRFAILLSYCAVFHFHFAGKAGVLPIVVLGIITYVCGYTRKKPLIIFAITSCVLALCFYKYMLFLTDEVIGLASPGTALLLKASTQWMLPDAAPLAISFFTFEFVHYLVDVLKGSEPIKAPHRFAAFAIFFPSLVAGPIKRYQQFLPSLDTALQAIDLRKPLYRRTIMLGFLLVLVGFFKKLVIADNCTNYTDFLSGKFTVIHLIDRWIFVVVLSFKIYMDFAGYSDIAIGLAKMMGIELPRNFNWPYMATNLREFWHRWHMSLSQWIRDYIYIPLGGGHSGRLRTAVNIGLAFALCGLWHGSHWNYVLWGLYHGLGLTICVTYPTALGKFGKVLNEQLQRVPLLAGAVTYLFVAFGWLLFFYPPAEAWTMFSLLFKW